MANPMRSFFRPQVIPLEDRTLLSVQPTQLLGIAPAPKDVAVLTPFVGPQQTKDDVGGTAGIGLISSEIAYPSFVILNPANGGSPTPAGGFTPAQIKRAYGIDKILFGAVAGNGAGQTIAIVDAYDDPGFVDTGSATFANSDLHRFDLQFGLPDPPSFKKINQTGGNVYPPTDPAGAGNPNGTWEVEIALDVEWAHAIAPKANIILVEATDSSIANLFTAVAYARTIPSVSVVSMSFGGGELAAETTLDSVFTTPAGHTGITFLAATGDTGQPGGYPAYSPNVVAVGGTTLTAGAGGAYISERAWSGSGGGISQFESKPTYQNPLAIQSASFRTIPDVAFDADPASGVAVYDSFDNADGQGAWLVIGGTSFACPAWAGLISIANQERTLSGNGTLKGNSETLPKLYKLPATDFHDILAGNNGFAAGAGYDLTTGRGTPKANLCIPALGAATSSPLSKLKVLMPIRLVYNASTGYYSGYLTLSNTTALPILGPFLVGFGAVPSGVGLANGTASLNGKSAVLVTGSIAAHSAVHVFVQFTNPYHLPLGSFFVGSNILVASES